VRDGVSGFVAERERDYLDVIRLLMADPQRHRWMRNEARRQALGASWDNVFEEVLEAYSAATSGVERPGLAHRRCNGGTGRLSAVSRESGRTIAEACAELGRHPIRSVMRRWHWKSAALSSLLRALLFFATSLAGGGGLAARAAVIEFVLRIPLVGVLAAVAQTVQDVEPAWAGVLVAMALIPALAHVAEFLVQWLVGTPDLAAGMIASVAMSMVSTVFTVFVMRRGVMIVGEGARPFGDDLRQLPRLLIAFALAVPRALVHALADGITAAVRNAETPAKARRAETAGPATRLLVRDDAL